MHNENRSSINRLTIAAVLSGLLVASAGARAGVIFQADFNGPGGGAGGSNDLVTVGGTGVVQADGTNTICTFTNTEPFVAGGGNYMEVTKLSGGGPYAPVLFTFDSASNTWPAWQSPDITDTAGNTNVALHGAYDVIFRVDNSSSTNDMSSFRTVQQYSWSDGGNGLAMVLNGQTGGYLIFQLVHPSFTLDLAAAITNFTSSGGSVAYLPQYDEIDGYFNPSVQLTNGVPYHVAYSLDTDPTGVTTLGLYLKQGAGAIDTNLDRVGWANFQILADNMTDWNGNPTDVCFTNQPWNFGAEWAADGPFVTDYARTRIFEGVPSTFSGLAKPAVIFQADFKGPGGGEGGSNDLATLGGTGVVQADGTNTICTFTNTEPFVAGGGNYMEVTKLSGGGPYAPVLFTFDSAGNTWPAWQSPDITDTAGNTNVALHGAYDVIFRVDSSSSTNDMSSFRTVQQYSWSDGGNGLAMVLNGQTGGYLIFQLVHPSFTLDLAAAITNFTSSGGSVAYLPQYDEIDGYFNPSVQLTNGVPYHVAYSLDTDPTGVTTLGLYLKQGAGAIDTNLDRVGWANFQILADNMTDWNGNPTDVCFTNQPWNFGAEWAADGPFVTDYARTRIFEGVPAAFSGLSGAVASVPVFLPTVINNGQITLTWTGNGTLQWASSVAGPWTTITPAPASPYSEALTPGNRFYRLLAQ